MPVKTFPSSFKKKLWLRKSFLAATMRNDEELQLGLWLVLQKGVVFPRSVFPASFFKSLLIPDEKVDNFGLINNMVESFEELKFIWYYIFVNCNWVDTRWQ